eukprot:TRINITY_DN6811_c0_g4_i3.p1 TRINITY_DN6811_c0_g4~~TRINITY_DN6811_c0_g4_i3.p1  ORF type:complete len:272 (+),score=47.38 TRINITY_DN6811_c0_g4_i3:79-894(+)
MPNIFLTLAIFCCATYGSTVISAKYRVDKGFVHEENVKVASVEIELDEDLYVAPQAWSCPEVKSKLRNISCKDSCDYTATDDTCNKPSKRLLSLSNYSLDCDCGHPEYCDQSVTGWVVLEAGKTIFVEQLEQMARYRFFSDSLDGYVLHWELEEQRMVEVEVAQFFLGPTHIVSTGFNLQMDNNGYGTDSYYATGAVGNKIIEMCPQDKYYPLGTAFVGIRCYPSSVCRYNITLEKKNSTNWPVEFIPTKYLLLISTHSHNYIPFGHMIIL